MIRGFYTLFFLLGVFLPLSVFAQGYNPQDSLSVSIVPEHPKPYETVSVTPRSSLLDLISSTVTISANGKKVEEGSGLVTGYVRAGAPGEKTTITVSVVSGGTTYTKTIVIRPASVALVVEPASTTHPFYLGGSLVASEGLVRLIAIPDFQSAPGVSIKNDQLTYTWRLGQQVLQSVSGIGKSSVTATAPVRYRDATLSVTVTNSENTMVAYASTIIAPTDPIIKVYANDPLLGPLFDRALPNSLTMETTEQTFRMVPYFFATTPSLSWSVNGSPGGVEKDVTVRATGNGKGSAVMEASAKLAETFQSAKTSLSVSFGEQSGLGIFGL
jgi:hypothetical protein